MTVGTCPSIRSLSLNYNFKFRAPFYCCCFLSSKNT